MAQKPESYPWQNNVQVNVSKLKPSVRADSLTAHQQRVLWEGIKALEPLTADLIKNDAGFAAMKTAFKATLVIELHHFNRFIEAGQRIIEERNHAHPI